MSLMTIERPSESAKHHPRKTVQDLFGEVNTASQVYEYHHDILDTLAEHLLPTATLRELRGMLPPPCLAIGRWVGGKPNRRSFVVALTYRNSGCYRRRDQVIVVSPSMPIKGIMISGKNTAYFSMPTYLEDLRLELEDIIRCFVHDCPLH